MSEQTNEVTVSPEVPEALPGRVILRFPKPKEQYKGILVIPKQAQRIERNVAEVVDVGIGTDEAERLFSKQVKRGDKVIANPIYGEPFQVGEGDDSETYYIFRTFEIIGKLPQVVAREVAAVNA